MTKYKLQEMPDVHNTGKRRVYPKIVTNRTLSRKEFIKRMQGYHRGISESTTEAVLLDVADMLVEMLSMGYNVNLEGIGTFSLSLGFEDDKPTEMQSEEDEKIGRTSQRHAQFLQSAKRMREIAPLRIPHRHHQILSAQHLQRIEQHHQYQYGRAVCRHLRNYGR